MAKKQTQGRKPQRRPTFASAQKVCSARAYVLGKMEDMYGIQHNTNKQRQRKKKPQMKKKDPSFMVDANGMKDIIHLYRFFCFVKIKNTYSRPHSNKDRKKS